VSCKRLLSNHSHFLTANCVYKKTSGAAFLVHVTNSGAHTVRGAGLSLAVFPVTAQGEKKLSLLI